MNRTNKRIKLWDEINKLCIEIAILKTGKRKAFVWEIEEVKHFWLNFFGSYSLGNMTVEELKNFKALLISKVEAEFQHKSIPGILKKLKFIKYG